MNTIIFDMDGTLINSSNVITNCINFVRENIGLERMDKNEILTYINTPHINTSEILYKTSEFTDSQTELFTEYYNNNCTKDISLYDGIFETLEKLKNSNKKLAVATNASSEFANSMLSHLEIDNFFDLIVGADMVENSKPSPDMILKVLNETNSKKEHSILIGDSYKDKLAAQSAEIDFLLVDWGFSDYTQESKLISHIDELFNFINIKNN